MIINRLQLENFKRFGFASIDFNHGTTGIVGTNGSGKSSIVEALFFALFGVSDRSLPSDYIVSSFANSPCTVKLNFSVGNQNYLLCRTFRKGKTVQHDAVLYNGEGGTVRASGVSQVDAEVRKILGMGPVDFRNTSYAPQKDLLTLMDLTPGKRKEWFLRAFGIDYLNKGSQEILKAKTDALEKETVLLEGKIAAMMVPPDELADTRREIIAIGEKIFTLKAQEGVQRLTLDTLSEAKVAYDLAASRHSQIVERYNALLLDVGTLKTREDTLTRQMASIALPTQSEMSQMEEEIKKIPVVRLELEEFNRKKTRLDQLDMEDLLVGKEQASIQGKRDKIFGKLAALEKEKKEQDGLYSKIHVYFDVPEVEKFIEQTKTSTLEQATRLKTEIRASIAIQQELTTAIESIERIGPDGTCPTCKQKLGEHFEETLTDYKSRLASAIEKTNHLTNELDVVMATQKKIDEVTPLLNRIRQIDNSLSQKASLEQECGDLHRPLKDTMERISGIVTERITLAYDSDAHVACRNNLAGLEKLQEQFNGLTKQTNQRNVLMAQIDEIASQISQKGASLDAAKQDVSNDVFDATAGAALAAKIKETTSLIETISRDIATMTERQATLSRKVIELELIGEQIAENTQDLIFMREEIETLKLTRQTIADYVIYLMQVARGRIESDVSSIISEITGGKYDRVFIDAEFNLLVRENDKEYAVDRFSGGEQDDIAVALRVALSRYLADLHGIHESTLLIFDEIFGSQDEERRTNLLTALRSQKSRFPQIILISHISEIQGEFENTLVVRSDGQMSTVTTGTTGTPGQ